MNESKVIDDLFNAFKDSHIFKTIKTGRVTLNGATYGDYTEMGKVIDPKSKMPLEIAEDFFELNKKAAKELRTRIAAWRKENIKPDPVTVLVVEGDDIYEEDIQGPITAKLLLDEFRKDRNDPDDWDVTDDKTVAGIRTVQLIDRVEGESMKYMWVI